MDGVDVAFHFGGLPHEADWASIQAVNIEGTFNVYEAARRAGDQTGHLCLLEPLRGFPP